MNQPYKVREDVDNRALDDITVAPPVLDRYAGVVVDRYALIDRYPETDRYATIDRYAEAPIDRYGDTVGTAVLDRHRLTPKKKKKKKPKGVPGGQLLWIEAWDYESCWENWERGPWRVGEALDFDEAVGQLEFTGNSYDDDCDGDDVGGVCLVAVDSEKDTFACTAWDDDSGIWPDLMPMALALRKELAGNPARTATAFDGSDLWNLGGVLGSRIPTQVEVALAIHADSSSGLGAAALDYAIWHLPERYGHTALADGLADLHRVKEEGRLEPRDNFLVHVDDLLPGTFGKQHEYYSQTTLYSMHGVYLITKVTYHSDLSGDVVAGWRSLWLKPFSSDR